MKYRKRITIRISKSLVERLKKRARLRRLSDSALVCEALEDYFGATTSSSAYDLAREAGLIGCVRGGPSDLSTLLFFFLLIPLLAAQTATEVEVTAEPSHHLAVENEYVRVFKVEIAPHTSTLMHRHRHDYVYVTLGDAHFSNEVEGKPPVEVKLADGDTRFAPGNFAHVAKNLSDQPFRNLTIELLQDEKLRQTPSHWPEESGEKTFPGGRSKILFVKDGVRVSEVNLEPGAIVPSHHHDGPHLLVAVTDLDLRSDVQGIGPMPGQFKSGDAKWLPGGYTHTLTNVGKSAARIVTVEF